MNDYKELIELLAHPVDGRDSADIMIAAADAIEQLVAEYHKVKKQRDAAIAWLPKTCGYCKHYNGLTCNNKDCRNISGVNIGWEWRGEQE